VRHRTLPGKYTVGSWQEIEAEDAQKTLAKQVIATQHLMVVRCLYRAGSSFAEHTHPQEQITIVEKGVLEYVVEGEVLTVGAGQMLSIVAGIAHSSRVVGAEPVRALNIFHAPAGSGSVGEPEP
jgi:quercetin dioxygenase-like cupin family protein